MKILSLHSQRVLFLRITKILASWYRIWHKGYHSKFYWYTISYIWQFPSYEIKHIIYSVQD